MTTQQQRKAFEAEFPIPDGVEFNEAFELYQAGVYSKPTVGKYNAMWRSWQKAWQAAQAQLVPDEKPEYKISACYFPGTGEVELSWEQLFEEQKHCALTLPVTEDQGKRLIEVIGPCVYYRAQPAQQVPEGWKLVPVEPQNIREGYPYDDPAFEQLCRDHGIWGTDQSALAAVFWEAPLTTPNSEAN